MQGRRWLAVICLAVVAVAACGDGDGEDGGSDRPADGDEVEASASFEITLGEESASFEFPQSEVVPSHLDWTPQVPVNLHAGEAFGDEFSLAGRVEEGEQETSDAVVVGLNVELGTSSALFVSDDGTCTVTVDGLTDSRIEGSFTCDAEYGEQPLIAEGTFEAS